MIIQWSISEISKGISRKEAFLNYDYNNDLGIGDDPKVKDDSEYEISDQTRLDKKIEINNLEK